MAAPTRENFFNSYYENDAYDQGYFSTDEVAHQGRVNNCFDALKHTLAYPLRPIKVGGWLLVSTFTLIGAGCVALFTRDKGDSENPSKINTSNLLNASAATAIFAAYDLTCLVLKILVIVALVIGIAFPEIGKKARAFEKAFEDSLDNFISESFNIDFGDEDVGGFKSREEALTAMGLSTTLSPDDIKREYKKLALKYHPDKNPDAEAPEKFKVISSAYKYLENHPPKESGSGSEENSSSLINDFFKFTHYFSGKSSAGLAAPEPSNR